MHVLEALYINPVGPSSEPSASGGTLDAKRRYNNRSEQTWSVVMQQATRGEWRCSVLWHDSVVRFFRCN